jgi:hypothetical protein
MFFTIEFINLIFINFIKINKIYFFYKKSGIILNLYSINIIYLITKNEKFNIF